MKKLLKLGLVIPVAVLIAFASISLAADSGGSERKEVKKDQSRNVSDDALPSDRNSTQSEKQGVNDSRSGGSIDRRGRQERRGQSAIEVSAETASKKGSDSNSGKSSDSDDEDDEGQTQTNP